MALDDMPVFSLPEYKGNPQKKPKFESDNYYINRMTIADDARKIQTETINTAIKRSRSAKSGIKLSLGITSGWDKRFDNP